MLETILNWLPTSIVRSLGDASFSSLKNRGKVETWIVFGARDNNDDSEFLVPGNYYYLGLQIRVLSLEKMWEWFVYDAYGEVVIANAYSHSEKEAIEDAQQWIENFLTDEDENEVR